MLEEKECDICSGYFLPTHPNQKHCPKCQENPRRIRTQIAYADQRLDRAFGHAKDKKFFKCCCKQCQKDFMSKSYPRDFCSPECKLAYNDSHIVYAYCGQLMSKIGKHYPKRSPGVKVFCSDDCQEHYKWQEARQNNLVDICPQCKKEFIVQIRKENGGYVTKRQKFCSMKCARSYDPKNRGYFEYVSTSNQ